MAYTSDSEFEVEGRVQITNEVPPMDIYENLHTALKNDTWKWLLGWTDVTFGLDYKEGNPDDEEEPLKIVNGKVAEEYGPKPESVWDPEKEEYVEVKPRKQTRIEVNGVLMPENDLFLHEIYRYLGYVYPNHPDWVELLTHNEIVDAFENAAAIVDYKPDDKFFLLVAENLEKIENTATSDNIAREELKLLLRNLTNVAYRRKFYGASNGLRMIAAQVGELASIFPVGQYLPLKPELRAGFNNNTVFTNSIHEQNKKLTNEEIENLTEDEKEDYIRNNVPKLPETVSSKDYVIDTYDKNYKRRFRIIDWLGESKNFHKKFVDETQFEGYSVLGDPKTFIEYFDFDSKEQGQNESNSKIASKKSTASKYDIESNAFENRKVYITEITDTPISSFLYEKNTDTDEFNVISDPIPSNTYRLEVTGDLPIKYSKLKSYGRFEDFKSKLEDISSLESSVNPQYSYFNFKKFFSNKTIKDDYCKEIDFLLNPYIKDSIVLKPSEMIKAYDSFTTFKCLGGTFSQENTPENLEIDYSYIDIDDNNRNSFEDGPFNYYNCFTNTETGIEQSEPYKENGVNKNFLLPEKTIISDKELKNPNGSYSIYQVTGFNHGKIIIEGTPLKNNFNKYNIEIPEEVSDYSKIPNNYNLAFVFRTNKGDKIVIEGTPQIEWETYKKYVRPKNITIYIKAIPIKKDDNICSYIYADFNSCKNSLAQYKIDIKTFEPGSENCLICENKIKELENKLENYRKNRELFYYDDNDIEYLSFGIGSLFEKAYFISRNFISNDGLHSVYTQASFLPETGYIKFIDIGSLSIFPICTNSGFYNKEFLDTSFQLDDELFFVFPKLKDEIYKNLQNFYDIRPSKIERVFYNSIQKYLQTIKLVEKELFDVEVEVTSEFNQFDDSSRYSLIFKTDEAKKIFNIISVGDEVYGNGLPNDSDNKTYVVSKANNIVVLNNPISKVGTFVYKFGLACEAYPNENSNATYKELLLGYNSLTDVSPFNTGLYGSFDWPNVHNAYIDGKLNPKKFEIWNSDKGSFDDVVNWIYGEKLEETGNTHVLVPSTINLCRESFFEINLRKFIKLKNRRGKSENLMNVEWLDYFEKEISKASTVRDNINVGTNLMLQTDMSGYYSVVSERPYTDPQLKIMFQTFGWTDDSKPSYVQIGTGGAANKKWFKSIDSIMKPNIYGNAIFDKNESEDVREEESEDGDARTLRRNVYSISDNDYDEARRNDAFSETGLEKPLFEIPLGEYDIQKDYVYDGKVTNIISFSFNKEVFKNLNKEIEQGLRVSQNWIISNDNGIFKDQEFKYIASIDAKDIVTKNIDSLFIDGSNQGKSIVTIDNTNKLISYIDNDIEKGYFIIESQSKFIEKNSLIFFNKDTNGNYDFKLFKPKFGGTLSYHILYEKSYYEDSYYSVNHLENETDIIWPDRKKFEFDVEYHKEEIDYNIYSNEDNTFDYTNTNFSEEQKGKKLLACCLQHYKNYVGESQIPFGHSRKEFYNNLFKNENYILFSFLDENYISIPYILFYENLHTDENGNRHYDLYLKRCRDIEYVGGTLRDNFHSSKFIATFETRDQGPESRLFYGINDFYIKEENSEEEVYTPVKLNCLPKVYQEQINTIKLPRRCITDGSYNFEIQCEPYFISKGKRITENGEGEEVDFLVSESSIYYDDVNNYFYSNAKVFNNVNIENGNLLLENFKYLSERAISNDESWASIIENRNVETFIASSFEKEKSKIKLLFSEQRFFKDVKYLDGTFVVKSSQDSLSNKINKTAVLTQITGCNFNISDLSSSDRILRIEEVDLRSLWSEMLEPVMFSNYSSIEGEIHGIDISGNFVIGGLKNDSSTYSLNKSKFSSDIKKLREIKFEENSDGEQVMNFVDSGYQKTFEEPFAPVLKNPTIKKSFSDDVIKDVNDSSDVSFRYYKNYLLLEATVNCASPKFIQSNNSEFFNKAFEKISVGDEVKSIVALECSASDHRHSILIENPNKVLNAVSAVKYNGERVAIEQNETLYFSPIIGDLSSVSTITLEKTVDLPSYFKEKHINGKLSSLDYVGTDWYATYKLNNQNDASIVYKIDGESFIPEIVFNGNNSINNHQPNEVVPLNVDPFEGFIPFDSSSVPQEFAYSKDVCESPYDEAESCKKVYKSNGDIEVLFNNDKIFVKSKTRVLTERIENDIKEYIDDGKLSSYKYWKVATVPAFENVTLLNLKSISAYDAYERAKAEISESLKYYESNNQTAVERFSVDNSSNSIKNYYNQDNAESFLSECKEKLKNILSNFDVLSFDKFKNSIVANGDDTFSLTGVEDKYRIPLRRDNSGKIVLTELTSNSPSFKIEGSFSLDGKYSADTLYRYYIKCIIENICGLADTRPIYSHLNSNIIKNVEFTDDELLVLLSNGSIIKYPLNKMSKVEDLENPENWVTVEAPFGTAYLTVSDSSELSTGNINLDFHNNDVSGIASFDIQDIIEEKRIFSITNVYSVNGYTFFGGQYTTGEELDEDFKNEIEKMPYIKLGCPCLMYVKQGESVLTPITIDDNGSSLLGFKVSAINCLKNQVIVTLNNNNNNVNAIFTLGFNENNLLVLTKDDSNDPEKLPQIREATSTNSGLSYSTQSKSEGGQIISWSTPGKGIINNNSNSNNSGFYFDFISYNNLTAQSNCKVISKTDLGFGLDKRFLIEDDDMGGNIKVLIAIKTNKQISDQSKYLDPEHLSQFVVGQKKTFKVPLYEEVENSNKADKVYSYRQALNSADTDETGYPSIEEDENEYNHKFYSYSEYKDNDNNVQYSYDHWTNFEGEPIYYCSQDGSETYVNRSKKSLSLYENLKNQIGIEWFYAGIPVVKDISNNLPIQYMKNDNELTRLFRNNNKMNFVEWNYQEDVSDYKNQKLSVPYIKFSSGYKSLQSVVNEMKKYGDDDILIKIDPKVFIRYRNAFINNNIAHFVNNLEKYYRNQGLSEDSIDVLVEKDKKSIIAIENAISYIESTEGRFGGVSNNYNAWYDRLSIKSLDGEGLDDSSSELFNDSFDLTDDSSELFDDSTDLTDDSTDLTDDYFAFDNSKSYYLFDNKEQLFLLKHRRYISSSIDVPYPSQEGHQVLFNQNLTTEEPYEENKCRLVLDSGLAINSIYLPPRGYGYLRNSKDDEQALPWDLDPDAFIENEVLVNSLYEPIYLADKNGKIITDNEGKKIQMKRPKYQSFKELINVEGFTVRNKGCLLETQSSKDSLLNIGKIDLDNNFVTFSNLTNSSLDDGEVHYVKLKILTVATIYNSVKNLNNSDYFCEIDKDDIETFTPDRVYFNPQGLPHPPVMIDNEIYAADNSNLYYADSYTNKNGSFIYECDENGKYIEFVKKDIINTRSSDTDVLGNIKNSNYLYSSDGKSYLEKVPVEDCVGRITLTKDFRFNPRKPIYDTCHDWFKNEFYVRGDEKNPFWQIIKIYPKFDRYSKSFTSYCDVYSWKKLSGSMTLEVVPKEDRFISAERPILASVKNNTITFDSKPSFIDLDKGELRLIINKPAEKYHDYLYFVSYGIPYTNSFCKGQRFSKVWQEGFDYLLSQESRVKYTTNILSNYTVNSTEDFADLNNKDVSIVEVSELAILDDKRKIIAYATFPDIEYRTASQHISFTCFINKDNLSA